MQHPPPQQGQLERFRAFFWAIWMHAVMMISLMGLEERMTMSCDITGRALCHKLQKTAFTRPALTSPQNDRCCEGMQWVSVVVYGGHVLQSTDAVATGGCNATCFIPVQGSIWLDPHNAGI